MYYSYLYDKNVGSILRASLFTRWPYLQRLRAARTSPILTNGEILKSQTLLAEITIKSHMSNQQINCPMDVVSYAQIAFKKLIFQSSPANVYAES